MLWAYGGVMNTKEIKIRVKLKTRERILDKAKKKESYDDYINRMIDYFEGDD